MPHPNALRESKINVAACSVMLSISSITQLVISRSSSSEAAVWTGGGGRGVDARILNEALRSLQVSFLPIRS
jgi:hypothetical protein